MGQVEQVAEFIASFDPWWMVAIAIALVLLDWALLQTEAFLALGLGLLILAVINALDFSPMVQLWSYPIAVFISFFLQRHFFKFLTTTRSPYESLETMGVKGLEVHVGEIGTLKVISNKDESSDHFFSYKDSIDYETRTEIENTIVTKVLLPDGSIHPSKIVDESEIHDGLQIRVIGVSNGALVVEKK